ncbi:hypothetical protein CLU79DRAFT_831617 [Phycomyces nitens]|nr:hypothetical protein CLU79DRAFT_837225 [Phycomyces nitens]KAI9029869.1 hypothetical protein CLU79DRAFT_831617 [Phycomyces nitens]
MTRSLLYVACSRATSADGLRLICKSNQFIPPKPITEDRNNQLQIEINRHQTVQLELSFGHLQKQEESDYTQLISHNVQSLRAHLSQITSDQVYLSSNILLFNETWTLPNHESCVIPGFTLVSSIDSNPTNARVSGACCYVRNSFLSRTIGSSNETAIRTANSRLFLDGNNGSTSVAFFVLNESLYCSIYVSPRCQLSTLMEALEFVVSHDYMHITIAGDFNVDFTKESTKKATLLQFMNSKNMTTTLPATIQSTTNQNTLIDNIFTTMPVMDSGKYLSLTSYHAPLWAKFM